MLGAVVKFNQYEIDGWKCTCGEIYYEPEQAERILLLNKVKKMLYRVKLNKIRSNLILRIPKDVGDALKLHKGKQVTIEIKNKEIIVRA